MCELNSTKCYCVFEEDNRLKIETSMDMVSKNVRINFNEYYFFKDL